MTAALRARRTTAALLLLAVGSGACTAGGDRRSDPGPPAPLTANYMPAGSLSTDGPPFNPDLLISTPAGLVGVGHIAGDAGSDRAPTSWLSTDGLLWRTGNLPTLARRAGRPVLISGLAAVGTTILAAGRQQVGNPPVLGPLVAYETTDGVTWREAMPPVETSGTLQRPALSVAHGRFVALTSADTISTSTGDGRWTRSVLPPSCDHLDKLLGPAVSGTCGGRSTVLLPEADGSLVVPAPAETWVLIQSVVSTGNALVLSGLQPAPPTATTSSSPAPAEGEGGEGGEEKVAAEVRRSEDGGRTWSGPVQPETTGTALPALTAITNADDALYAVGVLSGEGQHAESALWQSSDTGRSWRLRPLPQVPADGRLEHVVWRAGIYVATVRLGFDARATTLGIVTNQAAPPSANSPGPTLTIDTPKPSSS